jgi:hypothetical protein
MSDGIWGECGRYDVYFGTRLRERIFICVVRKERAQEGARMSRFGNSQHSHRPRKSRTSRDVRTQKPKAVAQIPVDGLQGLSEISTASVNCGYDS